MQEGHIPTQAQRDALIRQEEIEELIFRKEQRKKTARYAEEKHDAEMAEIRGKMSARGRDSSRNRMRKRDRSLELEGEEIEDDDGK